MISVETFRTMALSFPESQEHPHFEKTSFRVKKKIFATLNLKNKEAVVKFSLVDQSVFCGINESMIYPVNGAWGRQGWTAINLKEAKKDIIKDALTASYCEVAPKKLADAFKNM